MIDFTHIDYLKTGNQRQQKAYTELKRLSILEDLEAYNPILTGTIPIGIDLPESDLDIICECSDHKAFARIISSLYSDQPNFQLRIKEWNGLKSVIATFRTTAFEIEIFGQNCPTTDQNAYKHMLIEHEILMEKGDAFKKQIILLKQNGLKTEPAFAHLLELSGDPYTELLKLKAF